MCGITGYYSPKKCDITAEELQERIKSLEKDVKVLQRLYFIKYRYEGVTVEEAASRVEIHWSSVKG